jgi:hypothetical protein
MTAMSRFASFLRPWLLGLSGVALTTTAGLSTSALPALAQATPGLMEFRWENNKDYRKLYFFQSETARLKRAEYYLLLRPKDRKTAILKLTITIPATFNTSIEPKRLKFCKMAEGGMLKRTRCEKTIPATIEVAANGRSIDIFPDTPVSEKDTIGLFMNVFNPDTAAMSQFNALAQAPGQLPISSYLGSWLIQIDP